MVSDCWPPVFRKGYNSPKRMYSNISIHLSTIHIASIFVIEVIVGCSLSPVGALRGHLNVTFNGSG